MSSLLEEGVKFHGHLGPYLVLGLRMGRIAFRKLKPKDLHDLSVNVWTKKTPPQSCLLDGIQVSSGCTLGKMNIEVKPARHPKAIFRNGKRALLVKPSKQVTDLLETLSPRTTQVELRRISLLLYQMSDHALLVIE